MSTFYNTQMVLCLECKKQYWKYSKIHTGSPFGPGSPSFPGFPCKTPSSTLLKQMATYMQFPNTVGKTLERNNHYCNAIIELC